MKTSIDSVTFLDKYSYNSMSLHLGASPRNRLKINEHLILTTTLAMNMIFMHHLHGRKLPIKVKFDNFMSARVPNADKFLLYPADGVLSGNLGGSYPP